MEDNSYLPNCKDDDVLIFEPEILLKVGKLREATKQAFEDRNSKLPNVLSEILKSHRIEVYTGGESVGKQWYSLDRKWFGEGIDCEILRLGARGWQKGKARIRVSLDFYPDEPEIPEVLESDELENSQSKSLLDDVRQIAKDT